MPKQKKIKSGTLAIFRTIHAHISKTCPKNNGANLLASLSTLEEDVVYVKKDVLVLSKKSFKPWDKWVSYCWVLAVNKKDNTHVYGWVETHRLKPLT